MAGYKFSSACFLVAGCLLLAACAQATPRMVEAVKTVELAAPAAATEAPAAVAPFCPPIQSPATVSIPGEITKITIPAGATALYDPGAGAWCDIVQLKLTRVPLSELVAANGCFTDPNDKTYPCSVYNALAAVDIQPSRIKFYSLPLPLLVYDLSKTESQPYCTQKGPDCGGFAVYKLQPLIPSSPSLAWRYVSPASLLTGSTPPAVEAKNIDHFSTFTLVELPPPQSFPSMITSALTIASAFMPEESQGSEVFTLAFLIRDDTLGMNGQTRLFRFSYPEMQLTVSGSYPTECLDNRIYPGVPQQLSCLFPVDMQVALVNGADGVAYQVSLTPSSGEYEARLFANLEVH
jgi:hypothetical protein